jgi:hypothetical protein
VPSFTVNVAVVGSIDVLNEADTCVVGDTAVAPDPGFVDVTVGGVVGIPVLSNTGSTQ